MEERTNKINRFDSDLTTDVNDYHIKEGQISHLRNGVSEFDTNNRANEPANKHCIDASYPIIGYIYLYEDNWVIFSTDNTHSEIGMFKELTCSYSKLPGNFDCLNLSQYNLITGISKQNFDCTWSVYWSDGYRNSDRTLNITNIPYVGTYGPDRNNCQVFTPTPPLTLDCSKIKLNRLVKIPCVKSYKAPSGGNLLNGTYYGLLAYTVNGQRVSDYVGMSNAVSIFSHENVAGSIEFELTGLDDSFDQYEFVVVSIVNQQTVATRMGLYSTNQKKISYDIIDKSLSSVPLEFLPVHNPLMDSSASISELGDSMLRIAPRTKFDPNYQPQANLINVEWVSVEYPADYHREGGVNAGFLRDENYALFIQGIYDDGDLTSSYHIPGRAPGNFQDVQAGVPISTYERDLFGGANAIETLSGGSAQLFEVVNTAKQTSTLVSPVGDGGYEIARGKMGYFETSELYPINQPAVWGNLCGKNIRHHKFPERTLTSSTDIYQDSASIGVPIQGGVVRIMGIALNNISQFKDNSGNVIPNIVGYRILKGSREGNKTIIAEGIINNMFEYDLPDGKTGLIQNYPYNDLHTDPFISTTKTKTTGINGNVQSLNGLTIYRKKTVTFHSPDTTFRKPFLGAKELKLYGAVTGRAQLDFREPDKHPKHKLPTNMAFFIAAIGGIGYAVLELNGKRTTRYIPPTRTAAAQNTYDAVIGNAGYLLTENGQWTTVGAATAGVTTIGPIPLVSAGTTGVNTPTGAGVLNTIANAALVGAGSTLAATAQALLATRSAALNAGADLVEALGGATLRDGLNTGTIIAANLAADSSGFVTGGRTEYTSEGGKGGAMGNVLQLLQAGTTFLSYWGQGTDEALKLLLNFSQAQQYALQQVSHCFYNTFDRLTRPPQYRHNIKNAQYLGSSFQELDANTKINNLYRASTVVLDLTTDVQDIGGGIVDNSKQTLKSIGRNASYDDPTDELSSFVSTASSYYAALKVRLRNQYGQIGDVKQIPIGCVNYFGDSPKEIVSPILFGGDTYITRYTEKNTMFFFYEWLYNQPDFFEYDYFQRKMLPNPAYWINSKKYDLGDFLTGLVGGIASGFPQPIFASDFRVLDNPGTAFDFVVKKAYFYLFNSGIRDFYVESEVNVGYRDWEEPIIRRHYDNKTSLGLEDFFRADPNIIKADNFYKYDYSLSVSRSFINFASWANVQPSYYNPSLAETCFTQHPKRIIYSLPQTSMEQIRDSWRIFLANNYRDFRSKITTVKGIGENGSIILFQSDTPLMIQGTETLQTSAGTKLTIGDGELLSQPVQSMVNADKEYQYGSCQNLRSIVNTPAGLYWISQDQGKILTASDGVINIAMKQMQYWFANYLPYEITKTFPTFELKDNAVSGVACQAIYDNQTDLLYFTKKDYKLKSGVTVKYNGLDNFSAQGLNFKLGDPLFFDDASWTISYDVKSQQWVSYHDWHPDLLMPSKTTFYAIKQAGVWKHNDRCDLYCNYFGVDYPFEIEFITNTALDVSTVGSLEYQLEVYKYDLNCYDRFLFLNENFDEAVVFNNEQVSGLLRLNLTPSNDPFAAIVYPIYNLSSVDVLYTKVENKYRFNQITDLTDDRGEFGFAQRMLWNTPANGYAKTLNPTNINYQKDPTQQKKIRHYQNSMFLRRKVSGNKKFVLNFNVLKLQNSPR